MQSILDLTDEEFHQRVIDVVQRELGLAGYARFLRLFTFCTSLAPMPANRAFHA
jgi:hypothetical protein